MSGFISRMPSWARWFSVGIILALFGGIFLVVSFMGTPNSSPASSQQTAAEFYTAAALTVTANQDLITPTPPIQPTDLVSATPSPTNFPAFEFTQPTTQSQPTLQTGCNSSIYVSDVTIPDGTTFGPGTTFVKTWMFQNTGTCTWDTNYQLIFLSGEQMGGTSTRLGTSVAPSQQAQASVSLTAPAAVGNYTGYWRLADDQGNPFGESVTVVIVVSSSAPTITPTSTTTSATSTPTLTTPAASGTPIPTTPAASSTPIATSSSQPSVTPTQTVTPTLPPTATDTRIATSTSAPTLTPTPPPTATESG